MHNSHYKTASGIQAIDIIDAYELNFNLGNVIKYCCRAGRKAEGSDAKEAALMDLQKAKYYLQKELEKYQDKA